MKTKLLFICSFNIDRSCAAEAMFRSSKKYEAKSAGVEPVATKVISKEDIEWADIIFVMDERNEGHKTELINRFPRSIRDKDLRVLGIPNYFHRYDPELYRLLRVRLEKEGIDVDETRYEDFIEGLEEKKEIEKLEGEKVEKKMDKPFQIQMCTGMGASYSLSYIAKDILKDLNKTPEEKAKEKEEEAKNKKIREDNRRGWVK